ncbi:hypothetical protein CRL705_1907 [Latilactobacillus curvatus CRL 705]|nr:hypothetical protein CRL705_1907 [Latilactobacillus curvatus CRL 705]
MESSPYTWGVRKSIDYVDLTTRIIPIYMGEYPSWDEYVRHGKESSPYTWGVRNGTSLRIGRPGIIPIYMGSTFFDNLTELDVENHPHIHGEYNGSGNVAMTQWESSPYTWGVHAHITTIIKSRRIIPIYMGSTNLLLHLRIPYRNHPHIHGEYSKGEDAVRSYLESSPYTWGVLYLRSSSPPDERIIPIYMGSTSWDCFA